MEDAEPTECEAEENQPDPVESNVLCSRKSDFDAALKASLLTKWDECKAAMRLFSYFDNWTDENIRECCILSKIRVFAQHETIFGAGTGQSSYVHFVLNGELRMVAALQLAVNRRYGTTHYRQLDDVEKLKTDEVLEAFFLQVCLLKGGACFGLGENLHGRTIIANEATTCLLCPRYWILQMKTGYIWDRIITFMNGHIPTNDDIFHDFVEQRKWLRYRQSLIHDIVSKRAGKTRTSYHDVPYSLRMKEHIQHDRAGTPVKKDQKLNVMPVEEFEGI